MLIDSVANSLKMENKAWIRREQTKDFNKLNLTDESNRRGKKHLAKLRSIKRYTLCFCGVTWYANWAIALSPLFSYKCL